MRESRLKSSSTVFALTTDSPIIGFTEGSVLFIDALGTLAEDNANFFRNSADNALYLGGATEAAADIILRPGGTTADALEIDATQTSGRAIAILADSLEAGGGMISARSNSADTGARDLFSVANDNSLATGARVGRFENNSTEECLLIQALANGLALNIDSRGTTADAFNFSTTNQTTGTVINAESADSLTTGQIASLISNSTSTSTRNLVQITNDNTLATGTTVLDIQQDAAQVALRIDMNGNERALQILSEATTVDAMTFNAAKTTTADVISVVNADSLTTGRIFYIHSNSSDGSARELVRIHNVNVSADLTRVLRLIQDADERNLWVHTRANGESILIDSEATTSNVIDVTTAETTTGRVLQLSSNTLTTGEIINAYSASTSTSTRRLVNIHNDDPLATGATVLNLRQDAAIRNLFIDMNAAAQGILIDHDDTGTTASFEIDRDGNNAADIPGITLTVDNAGAGGVIGIDASAFSVDEAILAAPADAITTAGTVSHQIAIDIGGTIFYLVAHTHGT